MIQPWMKFYPGDWRSDPALRMCSIAARGLWMDMLCIMHEANPRGSLLVNSAPLNDRDLAQLCGCTVKEAKRLLEELDRAGVFSRDGKIIFSRRMRRDDEKTERDKANGKTGGHPDIRRGTVPKDQRVRRFRRSDAPAKAQRIFDRSNGACHWCQKPLDPENYHIDHVVAVRDGGSNDESNLVASCPDCNGERAMTWGRSDTDLMVGKSSDHKAYKLELDSEPERKKDEDAANAASSAARYAFESGIIRLNKRDFETWKRAYLNLSLEAELLSLTQWAAEQGPDNWYFAVQGALTKRNREVGIKLEQAKNQPEVKQLTNDQKHYPSGIPGVQ